MNYMEATSLKIKKILKFSIDSILCNNNLFPISRGIKCKVAYDHIQNKLIFRPSKTKYSLLKNTKNEIYDDLIYNHFLKDQRFQFIYTTSYNLHQKNRYNPELKIVPLEASKTNFLTFQKRDGIWDSKSHILDDLRETKAKVKDKVEEIIVRENIWTIPNFLCVGRILASPILCYAVGYSYYSFALGLFTLASFSDLVDGIIARNFPSQASRLGSFLDPLADKVLIASLFLSLTYVGLIPLPLTGLIIYRDFLMISAASYIRYRSLPPPVTLSRYFDATHATVQLSPTLVSKFNTAVQLVLISASLAAPVFGFMEHNLLSALRWFTALTTFASGISYIFSKDTYKYLSTTNIDLNKK